MKPGDKVRLVTPDNLDIANGYKKDEILILGIKYVPFNDKSPSMWYIKNRIFCVLERDLELINIEKVDNWSF